MLVICFQIFFDIYVLFQSITYIPKSTLTKTYQDLTDPTFDQVVLIVIPTKVPILLYLVTKTSDPHTGVVVPVDIPDPPNTLL